MQQNQHDLKRCYLRIDLSQDIGEDLQKLNGAKRVEGNQVIAFVERLLVQFTNDVLQLVTHDDN